MNKKKILILLILTVFCIAMSVSAVSAYKATCHSNGIGKSACKHNANWTKKDLGWSYCGKVTKNGYIYKEYVKLYQYDCVCYNKAHKEQLKLWKCDFPYTYESISIGSNPKYKYVKYAPATHTYKKGGYKFTVSNALYEKINYNKKHPDSKYIGQFVKVSGPKKTVKYKYYYNKKKWKYIYKKEKCQGYIHLNNYGKPIVTIQTYQSYYNAEAVSRKKWSYYL